MTRSRLDAIQEYLVPTHLLSKTTISGSFIQMPERSDKPMSAAKAEAAKAEAPDKQTAQGNRGVEAA